MGLLQEEQDRRNTRDSVKEVIKNVRISMTNDPHGTELKIAWEKLREALFWLEVYDNV